MSGTGLKKCMPTHRAGCSKPLAIAVIEIEEVFVAKTHSASTIVSSSLNKDLLTSRFSITASITSWTELTS